MGSGKRDFSEFSAKLEKHIERLPDYAQRAQEKLQKYLPPEGSKGAGHSSDTGASSDTGVYRKAFPRPGEEHSTSPVPSEPPKPPAPRSPGMSSLSGLSKLPNVERLAELAKLGGPATPPVVVDIRDKWVRWNDPAAKHERRKRRTSRVLTLWLVLALLGVLTVVAGVIAAGTVAAAVMSPPVLGGAAGAIAFTTLSVRSGSRLRQLKRLPAPVSTLPPPLPPSGSAARRPMEKLAESEASLRGLLDQLAIPSTTGVTAIPEISVADARATADEAGKTLRGLAARIQAIERAKQSAPVAERPALDEAIRALTVQLEDGLEGYGGLVAAAGRTVAASSDGMGTSKEAITDATDRLAGLAIALRELGS